MAKIVNVSEVDKKKLVDKDAAAEMEYEIKAAEELVEKQKDDTNAFASEVNKWLNQDLRSELKLKEEAAASIHAMPDYTTVPEYLYKADGTKVKTIPEGYTHRWVRAIGRFPMISKRRAQGYRFRFYDDICKDTEHNWERYGAEGWILNGDAVLMIIPHKAKEALNEIKRKRDELFTRQSEDDLLDLGAQYGVTVFKEADGRREYS